MFHSDVCCNFPVVEMNAFHEKVAKGKGFVILGAEVCVVCSGRGEAKVRCGEVMINNWCSLD